LQNIVCYGSAQLVSTPHCFVPDSPQTPKRILQG